MQRARAARTLPGLWKHGDFLKLWAAQGVSAFGSMVSGVAFSFTAVLFLHATAPHLALLQAATILPRLLTTLAAGVWVDRLRRRPLMIAADVGRAVLLGLVPAAAVVGRLRIELLYGVTFLTGILAILFDTADRSFLPTLLSREDLLEANSKLTATASAAEFGAFALGGWLVQWFTAPLAIAIDAASFLASALLLGLIRKPEPPAARPEERAGFRAEIVEGLRAVVRHKILRSLAAVTVLLGVGGGIFGTLVVAYMARDVGFRPGTLGMIWAVGGLSSLAGAAMAGPAARRLGIGPAMTWALLASAFASLLVPLAAGPSVLSGALLVGAQLTGDPAHTLYDVNAVSLRQAVTPERLLGRVNASLEFVGLAAALLGTAAAGVLGGGRPSGPGERWTLVLGVGFGLAAALIARSSPLWHERRLRAPG